MRVRVFWSPELTDCFTDRVCRCKLGASVSDCLSDWCWCWAGKIEGNPIIDLNFTLTTHDRRSVLKKKRKETSFSGVRAPFTGTRNVYLR
jgi:hypothetical protein